MPRGGRRVGSGRKPKMLKALLEEQGRVLPHPSSVRPVVTPATAPVDVPVDQALTEAERAVWARQAPHAMANGTLTPVSALAFGRYCQMVVLAEVEGRGANPGGPNHRGMLGLVNACEQYFQLAPAGKPMPQVAVPEAPVSKLSRFRK